MNDDELEITEYEILTADEIKQQHHHSVETESFCLD